MKYILYLFKYYFTNFINVNRDTNHIIKIVKILEKRYFKNCYSLRDIIQQEFYKAALYSINFGIFCKKTI